MLHRLNRKSPPLPALVGVAMLMTVSVVIGDSIRSGPDISWNTIDGGGAVSTAETVNGTFEFTGTIGQPDAHVGGPLTSGAISFTPAFWNDHAIGATPCQGDLTGDGVVDVNDLLQVITAWDGPGPGGDANHDGVVDVNDMLLVISHWGVCPGS